MLMDLFVGRLAGHRAGIKNFPQASMCGTVSLREGEIGCRRLVSIPIRPRWETQSVAARLG
jgi:hypothetical protein